MEKVKTFMEVLEKFKGKSIADIAGLIRKVSTGIAIASTFLMLACLVTGHELGVSEKFKQPLDSAFAISLDLFEFVACVAWLSVIVIVAMAVIKWFTGIDAKPDKAKPSTLVCFMARMAYPSLAITHRLSLSAICLEIAVSKYEAGLLLLERVFPYAPESARPDISVSIGTAMFLVSTWYVLVEITAFAMDYMQKPKDEEEELPKLELLPWERPQEPEPETFSGRLQKRAESDIQMICEVCDAVIKKRKQNKR